MSHQNEPVWTTLLDAGVVHGAAPETGKLESPWYVRALLAFSGWLAALFLLGFIGMGLQFIIKSSAASIIVGGAMIGGAFAMLRMPKNEFFEHLGMAVSLAGQVLVAWAVFRITEPNTAMAWTLVAFLQVFLAIVMPNFVHGVFSSFLATFAFSRTLTSLGSAYVFIGVVMLLVAWVWLNEFRHPRYMRKLQACGYGLVLALIHLKVGVLASYTALGLHTPRSRPEAWIQPWMGELLLGAVALYVVWQLLQRRGQSMSDRFSITALVGTALLCAVSLEAQGITIGVMILLLGFEGSNRVLLGLGLVSLLSYISYYYYVLGATLLAKSLTLLIVGLALLSARWVMLHAMPEGQEAQHA